MSDISVPGGAASTKTATVTYHDGNGEVTAPESPPVWSSSDTSVASVDSSADLSGVTAVVSVTGTEGTATIDAATTNTDGTVVTATGTVTVTAPVPGPPVDGDIAFS